MYSLYKILYQEKFYYKNIYEKIFDNSFEYHLSKCASDEVLQKIDYDLNKIIFFDRDILNNTSQDKDFDTNKIYSNFRKDSLVAIFMDCNFSVGIMEEFVRKGFEDIEEINFIGCTFEFGDIKLLEQGDFSKLRRLTLTSCKLSYDDVDDLFNINIPNLTELFLDSSMINPNIDPEKLSFAFSGYNCLQLTTLAISACGWEYENYRVLAETSMPNLRILSLFFGVINWTDIMLKFAENPYSKNLEIFNFEPSAPSVVEIFCNGSFPNIREITIKTFMDLNFIGTGFFEKLENLLMKNMLLFDDEKEKIWFELSQAYFPNLKKVYFPAEYFSGKFMRQLILENTLNLRDMTFTKLKNFDLIGLKALAECEWNIEVLNFEDCGIQKGEFCELFKGKLNDLKYFYSYKNNFNNDDIIELCNNVNLRKNLECLVLKQNNLNDESAKIFLDYKFENLKYINLSENYQISDKIFQLLSNHFHGIIDSK